MADSTRPPRHLHVVDGDTPEPSRPVLTEVSAPIAETPPAPVSEPSETAGLPIEVFKVLHIDGGDSRTLCRGEHLLDEWARWTTDVTAEQMQEAATDFARRGGVVCNVCHTKAEHR